MTTRIVDIKGFHNFFCSTAVLSVVISGIQMSESGGLSARAPEAVAGGSPAAGLAAGHTSVIHFQHTGNKTVHSRQTNDIPFHVRGMRARHSLWLLAYLMRVLLRRLWLLLWLPTQASQP